MAFGESVLAEVIVRLDEIFPYQRTDMNTMQKPLTCRALMERQLAIANPVLQGNKCIGFSAVWQLIDDTTIGSGISGFGTAECAITPTHETDSDKKIYAINHSFHRKVSVDTKDCNNVIMEKERIAYAMGTCMHQVALELNQYAIDFLLANKQTATNLGNLGTNIVAGVIEYDKLDMIDQDKMQSILYDWNLVAALEFISANRFVLNGTNWYSQYQEAIANAQNDDTRSQIFAFGVFPTVNDFHGFSPALADIQDTSFIVDSGAYMFMNRHQYTTVPTAVEDANATRVWSQPLQYIGDNGQMVTMMYNLGGQMVPVMADCRLQHVCNTASTVNGHPTYDWVMHISVAADFALAPNDGDHTGIVQIEAV